MAFKGLAKAYGREPHQEVRRCMNEKQIPEKYVKNCPGYVQISRGMIDQRPWCMLFADHIVLWKTEALRSIERQWNI